MATTIMVASQPPPPHLGNFDAIFDAFLKAQTGGDIKHELERKLSDLEKAKEKAKAKCRVKNELLNTPAARATALSGVRAVQGLRLPDQDVAPKEKEPISSPNQIPGDVADGVTRASKLRGILLAPVGTDQAVAFDSPCHGGGGSDTTLNSISVGSLRYSTATTTPPGSGDMTAATSPSAIVFDNSLSDDSFHGNGTALAHLDTKRNYPTKTHRFIVNTRLAASAAVVSSLRTASPPSPEPPAPAAGKSRIRPVPWSTPRFRCKILTKQPYERVKLFEITKGEPRDGITPHYMSTQQDKTKMLMYKTAPIFAKDAELKSYLPAASNPIHVFVDLSNIIIGFYDCLRLKHGIPVTKKLKAPPFSFDHLACVLERGRPVEKRVVAGSLVNTYNRKWPEYMQQAQDLDYEMNILQRVPKATPSPTRKRARRGTGEAGWTTSGAESSGEEAFDGQLKQGEQGVDELLHLKMLQSALDSEPGTAVLATGDAAEAEYSDGFKKNVERLLQSGWNVEIVGWSKGISSAWRDPDFTKAWGDRVRLIELDLYTEELFAAWFGAPGF